jgi:hypothetical protein
LSWDWSQAISESTLNFQLRGGLLSPEYRAESYPVIGSDQIGTSFGRAFTIVWDEHPQLQADTAAFGARMWREHGAAGLSFLLMGMGGVVGAAAGGEWEPASMASSLPAVLVPELDIASGSARLGPFLFRQLAFNFNESTPIGSNEGENPVGLFPTVSGRGQFLDRDLTATAGVNTRYVPTLRELRLQESFGLDYNLVRFNIGDYRAAFGMEGRLNLYQQIDLLPEMRTTFPEAEGTFFFQFRITEPPVDRSTLPYVDRPSR